MAPKADESSLWKGYAQPRDRIRRLRSLRRCVPPSICDCMHLGENRTAPRRAAHGRERVVTGINVSRPRDRDLFTRTSRREFDFILYANGSFNEINAARRVN